MRVGAGAAAFAGRYTCVAARWAIAGAQTHSANSTAEVKVVKKRPRLFMISSVDCCNNCRLRPQCFRVKHNDSVAQ